MRRAGHICFVVGILAALLGTSLWQFHRYLASNQVAVQVSSRLELALGVPVKVGRVDAGLWGSTLERVELFDPGTGTSGQPWATIEHADVDLSSWDLLNGHSVPSRITLRGVTITLRYDPGGEPVTRLPRPEGILAALPPLPKPERHQLPNIQVEQGRLVFKQQGHPELVITGIQGEVRTSDGQPVLTGTVDDPDWGHWVLSGKLSRDSQACSASLRSVKPVFIQRSALDKIPFVSPELWDQIQVEGEAPTEIAFQFDPVTQTVQYHATFEPSALYLRVPTYDLRMIEVGGRITLENNVIHLEDLHGKVADGEIEAHGDLRFYNTLLKLQVAVDVHDLRTDLLPPEWALPPEISGRLSGHADLRTTIRDARPVFHGQGQGVIADARVGSVRAKPVPVALTADGSGFHFSVR